jgi:YihY family inner membrane protein
VSGHGSAGRDRVHHRPEARIVAGAAADRAGELLSVVQRLIDWFDGFQQAHALLGFPVAVAKKYGDDRIGAYAATLSYYGFFSVLALFLVLVTVLGIVLQDNPSLQKSILDSALAEFPVIGDQIRNNVYAIRGNWITLAIGVIGALWGGLGVMQATQGAMNRVWRVPPERRPNFMSSRLRSLAMLAALGIVLLASTFLSTRVTFLAGREVTARALSLLGSFVLAVALFLIAYRVLTGKDLSWRSVLPGSIVGAFAWVVLQAVGGFYLDRQIKHATALYGYFGFTIGLLLWMSLGAQIVMYGAEINAVLDGHRWPRRLQGPPTDLMPAEF